jgi:hypothetical protein
MRTIILKSVLALAAVAAVGGSARAEGTTGVGVGGEILLDGSGGIAATYDADKFRIQGIFGFSDIGDTTGVLLAGRGLVPVHSAAMSDFSIGGGLGFISIGEGDNDNFNVVIIEAIGQARAFITSNVSLNFTLGFGVETADGDAITINSEINGSAGFTYFFY